MCCKFVSKFVQVCALSNDKLEDIGCLGEHGIAHAALEGLNQEMEAGLQAEEWAEEPDEEEDETNEIVVDDDGEEA